MRPRKILDKYYFHLILLVFGLLLSLLLYETYRPFQPTEPPTDTRGVTQAPKNIKDSVAKPAIPKDSIIDTDETEIAR